MMKLKIGECIQYYEIYIQYIFVIPINKKETYCENFGRTFSTPRYRSAFAQIESYVSRALPIAYGWLFIQSGLEICSAFPNRLKLELSGTADLDYLRGVAGARLLNTMAIRKDLISVQGVWLCRRTWTALFCGVFAMYFLFENSSRSISSAQLKMMGGISSDTWAESDSLDLHKYSKTASFRAPLSCESVLRDPILEFVKSSTRVPFIQVVLRQNIDNFVSTGIREFGTWDVHVADVLDFVIDKHGCWGPGPSGERSHQRTLLDVGSNVGFFGAHAASRGCRVYAFEPQQMASKCIFASSCVNGWRSSNQSRSASQGLLQVHRAPVSSTESAKFPTQWADNVGGVAAHICEEEGHDGCEELESIKLDRFLAVNTAVSVENPILAIKIDAEGYDADAASTATIHIMRGLVQHVFIELTPSRLGKQRNVDILRFLLNNGYHLAEVPYQSTNRTRRLSPTVAIPVHSPEELVQRCFDSKCRGLDGVDRHFTDVWASKDSLDFSSFNYTKSTYS